MNHNRMVLWSATAVAATLLAIMSLVLVAYALNRVEGAVHAIQVESHISCQRANTLRSDVRRLIHDQIRVTPRTPPQEAASIQSFLDETDRDLSPATCPTR